MKRVLLVPILALLLVPLLLMCLSAEYALAQTPAAAVTADVLRGPYKADALRNPYGVSVPLVALTGGGLRNPYGVSVPLVALTGEAARGPVAALILRRGDQPLADILRGPYDAPQAAPASSPFAWVLAGLAMVALIVALTLDFLRRKRQVAQPSAGATTVPRAH